MMRESVAAPEVSLFSRGEYSLAENKSRQDRAAEATRAWGDVKKKLSKGNVKEAAEAYNFARRYGNATDAEGKDLKEVESQLRKAQSGNLALGQQAVITANADSFDAVQQLPAKAEGLFDGVAAEQQWAKLQQAREVAVARVQPLRVNLPTRGVRYAFTQVLQADVSKPMTINLSAASVKSADWFGRIGLGAMAFLALWSLVAAMTRRPTPSRMAAA